MFGDVGVPVFEFTVMSVESRSFVRYLSDRIFALISSFFFFCELVFFYFYCVGFM